MSIIEQKYNSKCNTPTDINEHLPVLLEYARQVETIAEFGTRFAVSCYAFAMAKPKKLICVDLIKRDEADEFCNLCKQENINVKFDVSDTLKYKLEEVDLLFIDTLHTYSQLKRELELHNNKVNRYIILHDTVNYAFSEDIIVPKEISEKQFTQGLMPAVIEFLQDHREWRHLKTYPNNNGLTVLERR